MRGPHSADKENNYDLRRALSLARDQFANLRETPAGIGALPDRFFGWRKVAGQVCAYPQRYLETVTRGAGGWRWLS